MRRRAALSSQVEGFAQQRLAEHFLQCTCVWGVWQVPNLDAVPAMGLKEIGLRQRSGNRLAVVVSPSYKIGHKRQKAFVLTNRMPILP